MVDEKFIVNIKGKNFIKYEGLLNEAHTKGLLCIEVTMVQMPSQENGKTCICRATVIGKNHENMTDFGDASPDSVDVKIIPHIIRMAATRAKARALRDFCNIGMCSLEEVNIAELEGEEPEPMSPAQEALLKRLAKERGITVNFAGLDKTKASRLIDELQNKRTGSSRAG